MCGILGLVNKNEKTDPEIFSVMLETLEKRGPDQKGIFFDGRVALGHRRLSILDTSEAGKQPMGNENGTVEVVFNGEIYNYQKVKKSLEGVYQWKSRTDTEVLLRGYEEWGQKISDKIEGMFALAIYDKENQLITLARDQFGKKPLYYYLDDNVFCFASEPKAILKDPRIKGKISVDKLSLSKFLVYGYVPSPGSIFFGIRKVEPSTTFQFDIRKWKIINKRRFWNLEKIKINKERDEGDILSTTEALLKRSVEKRLTSDVPLGVFLSGGLDSSLVAALLSKISPKVEAFSVGYRDNLGADESEFARRTAKKLGIKLNLCNFEKEKVTENFMEMMDYLDEPLADAAIVPLYFVSKYSKDRITVALSGDGGDEIFGGYPKYKAQKFIEDHRYLNFLAKIGKNAFPKSSLYWKMIENFGKNFSARQFIFGSGSLSAEESISLLKYDQFEAEKIFEEALRYDKLFTESDAVNRSLFLDTKIQLPDGYLAKSDRAGMAASLEIRSPLLDKDLSEFVFSLGGNYKIRNGEQKYIIKKIAEKYLDRETIYREKRGFGAPLGDWIRKELKDVFREYLFLKNDYFNNGYIDKIYREHMSGKRDHQFKLLRIFSFNYSLKKFHE